MLPKLEWSVATTLPELREMCRALTGLVGFDVESWGPNIKAPNGDSWPDPYAHRLLGFSLSAGNRAWYVPVAHNDGPNCPRLAWLATLHEVTDLLAAGTIQLCAFNLGYELQILRNEGLEVSDSGPFDDASLSAWLGWSVTRPSLKGLCNDRYGTQLPSFGERFGKDIDGRAVPVLEMAEYAVKDPWLTCIVHADALVAVRARGLEQHYRDLDMPLVEVLRGMQARGVPVDTAALALQGEQLKARAAAIAAEFKELTTTTVKAKAKAKVPTGEFFKNGNPKFQTVDVEVDVVAGADIGNDHHVSRWLYDVLGWWKPGPHEKRNGVNNWTTKKERVEQFQILPGPAGKAAALRLEYQTLTKLESTYIRPLVSLPSQYCDGRLHTNYHGNGTGTDRLSSSSPNFQNLPARTEAGKLIRKAFGCAPGHKLIIFDYSQVELRIIAHLARVQSLILAYTFGEDVHQATLTEVQKVWPEATRTDAKIGNFSVIYRISAESLAVKMRCSVERAELMIEAFYRRAPEVSVYHDRAIAKLRRDGYVPTMCGYRGYIEPSGKGRRAGQYTNHDEAAAVNLPVQGTAGGIIKRAMIAIHRRWLAKGIMNSGAWLVEQTHDELGAEVREDLVDACTVDMRECMEGAIELCVPLVAEGGVGTNWLEAKE